ncbi:family 3 adenylate cyclase [Saccharomonospora viridis DSM 43017]|uniref:Family 3 adenylate cyclase n=1 Tax=Saccharomonospora viridis (strain ATCC 15386 / DSM 43017 / JCM 3036 / CCUG 5913 / NBRC 12207 / NCIMB 9602 / P101) TaxID=471857 RepID=C7MSF0_SACVD|nr:family 3 adenylate cyclase [Saccharomonospora viridis DSM 43017]
MSARLRAVLRTSLGFATIGFGTSFCGAALVLLLLSLQGLPDALDPERWVIPVSALGYVLLAFAVGTVWAGYLQRRTVMWFLTDREPTAQEAMRALRIPLDLAVVSGTLWAAGAVLFGVLSVVFGSWLDALGVVLTIVLGGFATTGLTYLAAERVARPLLSVSLRVAGPRRVASANTVLTRLVVTWGLSSGVPLVGVLLLLLPPDIGREDPTSSLLVLALIGLVVGALATALFARAVAAPLHRLRSALHDIGAGRRDVSVGIDDAGEIGMLQASVNDLAAGLRERERLRDLFGRHVGDDVARHALEHGISLSGDVREATALFVDVADSTTLAAELPPDEVVRRLNRLFEVVVEATNANSGLVNKFQGDAALCVFGAPDRHADSATAALRTARAIRDAVREAGELDIGVGVATGQVFAGQLGAPSRMEYTVIGDAVNEAARLTEHAKQVPGRVLASGPTIEAATATERARWHEHAALRLRGRSAPTVTWTDSPDSP